MTKIIDPFANFLYSNTRRDAGYFFAQMRSADTFGGNFAKKSLALAQGRNRVSRTP
jgi:hypothetical protein